MKRTSSGTILCVGLLVTLGACGDDPTFQLSFGVDASFQGPHAGYAIRVAVVRIGDGAVVADRTGPISATADPAFSFTELGLLERAEAYQLHYWIDSNFGGGIVGECDPPDNDHQWNVTIPPVGTDIDIVVSHDLGFTGVCLTFAP